MAKYGKKIRHEQKIYVLRHGAKIRDDIVAVTTEEHWATAFAEAEDMGWFQVDEFILDSQADLREVKTRIRQVKSKCTCNCHQHD